MIPSGPPILSWLAAGTALSTLVFAAVVMISRLLRCSSPRLHHALWLLVFMRLFVPPWVDHPLTLIRFVSHGLTLSPDVLPAGSALTEPQSSDMRLVADRATVGQNSAAQPEGPWGRLLIGGWLGGVAMVILIQLRRRHHLRSLMADTREVTNDFVIERAERWRHRLKVRRRVRIVATPHRVSPFTAGILKPVIVLPFAILNAPRLIEPVIAHELAHVARWDCLWLAIQRVVQTAYFFHPVLWISGRRLNHERERDCDARVLEHGAISRRDYARSLLDVMLMDFDPVHAPALGHRQRATSRIQSILADPPPPIRFRHAAAVLIVALGVLSMAAGPGETNGTPPATPGPDTGPTMERLDHPLPGGRLTWGWGPGRDPFNGREVHHRGIDLAAPAGTAILVPADATVRVASELWPPSPGSGTVLILDHDGELSTFFAHLQVVEVNSGQAVRRGEIVARVGSSGRSTGPHLHLEVWRTDEPVNPLDHLAPLQ